MNLGSLFPYGRDMDENGRSPELDELLERIEQDKMKEHNELMEQFAQKISQPKLPELGERELEV